MPFLFEKNKTYYLACSGGVDSMVLFFLMLRSKVAFEVLHVNFHLRGEDAIKDEKLVTEYAKEHGVIVHIQHFDTQKIHTKQGGNLEELCRNLRYDWFQTFLIKNSDSQLVTGHHLNDQIETFYWQLSRKAGMVGLSSLKAQNGNIIRPLLPYSKEEIYAFAKKHAIPWREDYTNHEINFTRNKLRNVFLPFLEKEISLLKESVITLINAFQNTLQTIENELKKEVELNNKFELTTATYQSWSIDKKYIFLHLISIRATALDELEKLANAAIGKYISMDNWFVSKKKNTLAFDKVKEEKKATLIIKKVAALPEKFTKDEIYLDTTKINGKLTLRKWQIGDKLEAIGVNGKKLVSKVINEYHLSAYEKQHVLVVTDDTTIHWIVGIKVGKKAVAQSSSTEIIQLSISNCDSCSF